MQATIVQRRASWAAFPKLRQGARQRQKVAVVGSGPAGLGAAAVLAQMGFKVDILEKEKWPADLQLDPGFRLDREMLAPDLEFALALGVIDHPPQTGVRSPETLLKKGYDAVLVAVGLTEPIRLGLKNEELAVTAVAYPKTPQKPKLRGRVAVIGGGAVAADCALVARENGAAAVELIALESIGECP